MQKQKAKTQKKYKVKSKRPSMPQKYKIKSEKKRLPMPQI